MPILQEQKSAIAMDVRANNCSCIIAMDGMYAASAGCAGAAICTPAIRGGRMPILHRYMDVTY